MASDMANDAWDNARDFYEQGTEQVRTAMSDFGPMVDAKTDELRAKVDLARERMDQLRETLKRGRLLGYGHARDGRLRSRSLPRQRLLPRA